MNAIVTKIREKLGSMRLFEKGWRDQYIKYELHMVKSRISEGRRDYRFSCASDVYAFLVDIVKLDAMTKEHFVVIAIGSKGDVNGYSVISIGDLSSSIVHPREVFQFAILCNAAAIIAAHNHPSGDPSASIEDIAATKRLSDCGDLLGIRLLDHIIVGDGKYESMRTEGHI